MIDRIVIPRLVEVQAYLEHNADLCDIVLSASKNVIEHFAGKAQLSLELYRDPEIEDEYLTLYVRQERYDSDILDELNGIAASFDGQLL